MAERFYYDVIIDHNPNNLDRYGYCSKAETSIELLDPLFDNPEEYNLVVSKFKIDTESIPLMIPELVQPQLEPKDGTVKTSYKVKISIKYYDLNADPTRVSLLEVSSESNVYYQLTFLRRV